MEERSQEGTPVNTAVESRREGPGTLFGIPLGDLGLFSTLLIGAATGFAAFFAGTFLGIVSLLVWSGSHPQVDYAIAYRWFGLPLGAVVLVAAWLYLGTLWVRRHVGRR